MTQDSRSTVNSLALLEQKKRVKVYALSTCAACKEVKKFLDEHNIKYEYIVVDTLESAEQWLITKEMKRYNHEERYPTIVVEEVIVGFNEAMLKNALNIK